MFADQSDHDGAAVQASWHCGLLTSGVLFLLLYVPEGFQYSFVL
jgi:hypothetical protein